MQDAKEVRILLVEDDLQLADLTKDYLEQNGYQVDVEENGKIAADRILQEQHDLVILDVMLPDMDGISVCRQVREKYKNPILMLTARTDQIDQILGLEIGADDYLCKPVEPRLLLAHVKALLRRISNEQNADSNEEPEKLIFDNLVINNGSRTVTLNDEEVMLTSSEYDLLWLLASNAGKVFSREDIFSSLRGIGYDGLNRTIDINISHIRAKIDDDGTTSYKRIKTIRNKGYMFVKQNG